MTWTKLSDDFADDCWTLSDAGHRLHVEGLTWSNRKLLDLQIPKEDVHRFKRPEAVSELLSIGWWTEHDDHYVIEHHARYQRSRDAVVNQQAANAANGCRGGRPPKGRPPGKPREIVETPRNQSVSESVTERNNDPVTAGSAPTTRSTAKPQVETQSVNDSLPQSITERDRTRTGSGEEVPGPTTSESPQHQEPKPSPSPSPKLSVVPNREVTPDSWPELAATGTGGRGCDLIDQMYDREF